MPSGYGKQLFLVLGRELGFGKNECVILDTLKLPDLAAVFEELKSAPN
jgi:hypothetical protein